MPRTDARVVDEAGLLAALVIVLALFVLAGVATRLALHDTPKRKPAVVPEPPTAMSLDDLKAFCGNVTIERVEFTREGSGLLPLPVPPNPKEYMEWTTEP